MTSSQISPSPVELPAQYICWTACRHCGLPYALRHKDAPQGHACSVASGCFVILPFRRCPVCDATVHASCPEGVRAQRHAEHRES